MIINNRRHSEYSNHKWIFRDVRYLWSVVQSLSVVWVMISSNWWFGGSLARERDFKFHWTPSESSLLRSSISVPPPKSIEMEIEKRSISSIRSLTEIPARLPSQRFRYFCHLQQVSRTRADEEISLGIGEATADSNHNIPDSTQFCQLFLSYICEEEEQRSRSIPIISNVTFK